MFALMQRCDLVSHLSDEPVRSSSVQAFASRLRLLKDDLSAPQEDTRLYHDLQRPSVYLRAYSPNMDEEAVKCCSYPKFPDNSTIIQVDLPIPLRWTQDLNHFILKYILHAYITRMDLWLVDTQSRSNVHHTYSQYDLSTVPLQCESNTLLIIYDTKAT